MAFFLSKKFAKKYGFPLDKAQGLWYNITRTERRITSYAGMAEDNFAMGEILAASRASAAGADTASLRRRRNKENFERSSEKGDYVSSGLAGADAKNKFNMRVWRNWQTR